MKFCMSYIRSTIHLEHVYTGPKPYRQKGKTEPALRHSEERNALSASVQDGIMVYIGIRENKRHDKKKGQACYEIDTCTRTSIPVTLGRINC
jgi:hypothetical protein